MVTTKRSRILAVVLACLMLASSLVIGSMAVGTAQADASPFCTNQLHTDVFCIQPLPATNCVSPYVVSGNTCAAYNTGMTQREVIDWTCPAAPFLAQVIEGRVFNGGGYSHIAVCLYTPAPSPYFNPPVFTPWNF